MSSLVEIAAENIRSLTAQGKTLEEAVSLASKHACSEECSAEIQALNQAQNHLKKIAEDKVMNEKTGL